VKKSMDGSCAASTRIVPAQPTSLSKGKVAMTEVFSYGCPYCNSYLPIVRKLKQALPANVVVDYLPASFNPGEDWPMFQRAYLTAQILGVAEKAHEAMFDAVWKTGELAILDPSTGQLKTHLPTIEDAARFYNRVTGISVADFVAAAKSMGVETRVGQTATVERAGARVLRSRWIMVSCRTIQVV
jgi:protein dithiol oxidoreductase (disulfide-forming)